MALNLRVFGRTTLLCDFFQLVFAVVEKVCSSSDQQGAPFPFPPESVGLLSNLPQTIIFGAKST